MATYNHSTPEYIDPEKAYDAKTGVATGVEPASEYDVQTNEPRELKRHLQGRHMQMIAIGGAIGAGFFVGSGSALSAGGPASLVICFMIIGVMLLFTMQALAEMAVLYPVNGAFYQYAVRFVDPSWGFACGWDYAIQWLTILPFEITAAAVTIDFWEGGRNINAAAWVCIFLAALIAIQFFGVRGYGEVEFVLSIIKVTAVIGFIILAIIIDCGAVPTQKSGYLGAKYWYDPYSSGGFQNGFQGFCAVFVTASFAFGGTELTGLAAAEASNPLKSIPMATRQVFWRISIFYVLGLFLLGLIVPSNDPNLLHASGANTAYSPFVIAIKNAGIDVLPSIFNVVITISVLSVANSSAYASTRTLQAMAKNGMAPRLLAYVDKAGRPLVVIGIQIAFGFLAFIASNKEAKGHLFDWLLALSGLANFFIWGSICLSHMRFRAGWAAQGRSIADLPYKAAFGVWGSAAGLVLNILCLAASFYTALFPLGSDPDPEYFFQQYLAAPLILFFYLLWKVITRDTKLFVRAHEMDITTGLRGDLAELKAIAEADTPDATWKTLPYRAFRAVF